MIEIHEKTYILGFWFCEDPKTLNNWLYAVVKNPEDNHWRCNYRFRYSKDDKIWDSDDEKSWWKMKIPLKETEESIIEKTNLVQSVIALRFPYTDKIIVKGDIKKLFTLSVGHPWMNIKGENMADQIERAQ
jgi:hypothetical protein